MTFNEAVIAMSGPEPVSTISPALVGVWNCGPLNEAEVLQASVWDRALTVDETSAYFQGEGVLGEVGLM